MVGIVENSGADGWDDMVFKKATSTVAHRNKVQWMVSRRSTCRGALRAI